MRTLTRPSRLAVAAAMILALAGLKRLGLDGEVRSALAQLPELHRVALTLRYFEDLDYSTIEQTLGLTNGALRGILGRALSLMRKRLKPALASTG